MQVILTQPPKSNPIEVEIDLDTKAVTSFKKVSMPPCWIQLILQSHHVSNCGPRSETVTGCVLKRLLLEGAGGWRAGVNHPGRFL